MSSSGKIAKFSMLLPYLVMFILFVKGLTLDGCGKGLEFVFTLDMSKFSMTTVSKACTMAWYSSGVGYGPLLHYGSARE